MQKLTPIAVIVLAVAMLFGSAVFIAWRAGPVPPERAAIEFADLAVHYDPSGKEGPADVIGQDFRPTGRYSAFGYLPGTLWFRFRLETLPNDPTWRALLKVGIPNLDEVILHYRDPDGAWHQLVSGDRVPLAQRPWASPGFAFALDGQTVRDQMLYLSIRSSGTLGISLQIGERDAMIRSLKIRDFVTICFLAALLAGIAATAWLYTATPLPMLLNFQLAQTVYFFGALQYSGFLEVLAPNVVFDAIGSRWIPLTAVTLVLFHVSFFRAVGAHRATHWAGVAILLAFAALFVATRFVDRSAVLQVSLYFTVAYIVVMAIAAWTVRDQSYLSSAFVRVIYSLYLGSIGIWILPAIGLMPAGRISFLGPAIQGIINITLIFAMVRRFSLREELKAQAAQRDLQDLRVEAEIRGRTSKLYRDLLWTISHEVGTGLTVFRLGLSRREITAETKARMQRALASLERLLDNFGQSEKLELGEVSIELGPVDMVEVIAGEAAVLDEKIDPPRLQILQPVQAIARTSEAYARLILSNLFSNALKYSPAASPVTVAVAQEGPRIAVRIENDCLPAAVPDVGRVFDRFYRNPRVLGISGTGLGLYIVQQLLPLLGGSCDFELIGINKVRVTLWLPAQD